MTAWIAYSATSAVLAVGIAAVVAALVGEGRGDGAWVAAMVAVTVQLPAYAALVASRRKGRDFLVSWASGMLLRFAVIAGAAVWVTRRTALDPAVTLLSLVGMVFLLVLLEPAFLKLADEAETKGPERTSED